MQASRHPAAPCILAVCLASRHPVAPCILAVCLTQRHLKFSLQILWSFLFGTDLKLKSFKLWIKRDHRAPLQLRQREAGTLWGSLFLPLSHGASLSWSSREMELWCGEAQHGHVCAWVQVKILQETNVLMHTGTLFSSLCHH